MSSGEEKRAVERRELGREKETKEKKMEMGQREGNTVGQVPCNLSSSHSLGHCKAQSPRAAVGRTGPSGSRPSAPSSWAALP